MEHCFQSFHVLQHEQIRREDRSSHPLIFYSKHVVLTDIRYGKWTFRVTHKKHFENHFMGTGDRSADLFGGLAIHVIPCEEGSDVHKFDRPIRVGF